VPSQTREQSATECRRQPQAGSSDLHGEESPRSLEATLQWSKELRHERMEACVGSRLGTTDTIELGRLTARERQVAHLAMVGLTNREMADTLCISAATVRNHLHRIYAKLGIPGRDAVSGALRAAMRSFGPERPNDHQRPLIAKHGMIGRLP